MKKCPNCGMVTYSQNDFYCAKCNYRLIEVSDQTNNSDSRPQQPKAQNIPRCPTCQSTDIKKISFGSKVAGAAVWGLLSTTARSQFQCNNCGYKW